MSDGDEAMRAEAAPAANTAEEKPHTAPRVGEGPAPEPPPPGGRLKRLGVLLWRTIQDARDDRIVGVAAELAFFALLALPPMILILAGAAGYVAGALGDEVRTALERDIIRGLGTFLAPDTMRELIEPAVRNLFARGRAGVLSIGAALALWSVSRMIKVLIEALNIAYDIEEWRPAWRRRLLALGLVAGGLATLTVVLPLVVAGPALGDRLAGTGFAGDALAVTWRILYWPAAAAAGVALLATLYHTAPNWQTPWRRDVPGAVFAAAVWLLAAVALRVYVRTALDEGAFGPLAAPVVLLLWLYVSAFAVLLGGELNAEVEKMWPSGESRPKARPEGRLLRGVREANERRRARRAAGRA